MERFERSATTAGWALFALWVWAPLAGWFAAPFTVPAHEVMGLILPGARRAGLLAETLAYAAGVAALATVVGVAAALYCWRRDESLAWLAERTALLAAPIPPYLHALAWLPLFAALPAHGAGGIVGWITAGWVQTLALLPFCFGLARLALEDLDPRWIEAGRVFGPDRRLLVRVLLPALRPAAFAALALAFLLTLADPSVPSLFSKSTYSMEVFSEFSATHDAARSMLLATPLALAGLLALVPVGRYWRAVAQRPAMAGARPAPFAVAGVDLFLLRSGAALTVLPALALMAALLKQAWPISDWGASLSDGLGSASLSAAAALIAAAAACLPALAVSKVVAAWPKTTWWLVSAPLAAPAGLAGAGLIWLWNRNLPVTPYGTFWMLVLAALARFTPLAVLAVAAWRGRLDPLLVDAAEVFAAPRRAFLRVVLPQLAPGLAAGAAVVFALSLGELGASLLVAPPGASTLALRIYNYLHYGASGSVAALALCLMGATAVAVLAATWLWRTWRD